MNCGKETLKITEIDNGWIVKEFSGSTKVDIDLDKTLFFEDWGKVVEEINAWVRLVDENGSDLES